jgi:hypothetical protein
MAKEIENKTGVPVVSITYDGTGGNKNESIIPYLKFPRKRVHHETREKATRQIIMLSGKRL